MKYPPGVRVRSLAFLSILPDVLLFSQTCEPVKLWSAHIVFLQPASGERKDEGFLLSTL